MIPMFALMAMQAAQGLFEGVSANKAYRASAAVDEENAKRTIMQGNADAYSSLRQSRLQMGEDMAASAADGQMVGAGSVFDMLYQQSIDDQMTAMNLRARAQGEAQGLRDQAKDKRKAGKNALISSLFGTVSQAIGTHAAQRGKARLEAQRQRERKAMTAQPGAISLYDPVTVEGGIPVPRRRIIMPRD